MKKVAFILLMLVSTRSVAQKNNLQERIAEANGRYERKAFTEAEQLYLDILRRSPDQYIAMFNLANALYRSNQIDKAIAQLDALARSKASFELKAKAFYNKAVLLGQQRKLDQSIIAYKNSLVLNPNDQQAQENLQRALNEKQARQQHQPKPRQQQEKLNQNQVRQLLNALQQHENQLRQRMNASNVPAPNKPEKDW